MSNEEVKCIHQFCRKISPDSFSCLECHAIVDKPYGKIKEGGTIGQTHPANFSDL